MRPDEFFAMIFAFVAFSLPFVLVGFLRFMRYREMLMLAEHGLLREDFDQPAGNGRRGLRWGIILSALGVALSCGLWPIGFMIGGSFPLGLGPWMLVGFLPLAFGIALLIIHRLSDAEDAGLLMSDEIPSGGPYGLGMDRIGPSGSDLRDMPAVDAAEMSREQDAEPEA